MPESFCPAEMTESSGDGDSQESKQGCCVSQVDLASLKSVRAFSARMLEEEPHIDVLINNAGVMDTPYTKTEDGFELQFGVNYLAHFLLTNLLLECLKEAPAARVVNVSSRAHELGEINFDDLMSERRYKPHGAYRRSKLDNILFTQALAKGWRRQT